MDPIQAHAIIVLSESRFFDTADIADLLHLKQADVARIIQAARDIRRESRRAAINASAAGVMS